MLSNNANQFTKENLDTYLKELAKAFRKQNGTKMPAEIILIGGAAILANYGFRNMTTDVDAIIHATSSMKDAIIYVRDKYNLPNSWLNSDFMRTDSYSPKLVEFSVYYKTFSNILTVRTISAEYLIAMKLRSARKYKNDLSDIIGILSEHKKCGNPLSFNQIDIAVCNLYGSWDSFSENAKQFIKNALESDNYEQIYSSVKTEEKNAQNLLINFNQQYPNVAQPSNINEILNTLKEKERQTIQQQVLEGLKDINKRNTRNADDFFNELENRYEHTKG